MENRNEMEAYQPFFFSGILISVLGVGFWGLFEVGLLRFYPVNSHAMLMTSGFLLAYVSGFLMTAIPKMSSTAPASILEISFGLGLLWLQATLALRNNPLLQSIIGLLQVALLIFFVLRRFFRRQNDPPASLVFLPFAFLCAMAGFGTILAQALDPSLSIEIVALGKLLLFQGFILNLVLGLGSRLIPALCRIPGSVGVRDSHPESKTLYTLIALVLLGSFFVEAFYSAPIGNFIKFAVVLAVAVWRFKIFTAIPGIGNLAIGLRLGVAFLGLGFLLSGLFPNLALHFMHLSYIGGFALITVLISTRVVLSHGGYSVDLELKSRELAWFFSVLLVLAVLRAVMGIQVEWRSSLIMILVFGWIFACGIWTKGFFKKLIQSE